jgi:hypothetical protein
MGWRGMGCGEEEKANDKSEILKSNKPKWMRIRGGRRGCLGEISKKGQGSFSRADGRKMREKQNGEAV